MEIIAFRFSTEISLFLCLVRMLIFHGAYVNNFHLHLKAELFSLSSFSYDLLFPPPFPIPHETSLFAFLCSLGYVEICSCDKIDYFFWSTRHHPKLFPPFVVSKEVFSVLFTCEHCMRVCQERKLFFAELWWFS